MLGARAGRRSRGTEVPAVVNPRRFGSLATTVDCVNAAIFSGRDPSPRLRPGTRTRRRGGSSVEPLRQGAVVTHD